MPGLNWIGNRLKRFRNRQLFVLEAVSWTYAALIREWDVCRRLLDEESVRCGSIVAVIGDHGPRSLAMMLALMERNCVLVPLSADTPECLEDRLETAEVGLVIHVMDCGYPLERRSTTLTHPLIREFRATEEAGLVLFSSGSSGTPKASLLSFNALLARYESAAEKPMRSLAFLKLDHIGGINTVFAIMLLGGTLVHIQNRSPQAVCEAIARHKVEVLPTTPTFLNMMLLSGLHRDHDLGSLKMITYGTEAMPQSTLIAVNKDFPHINLKQTYGLTELGILATQSPDQGSTWMKIRGDCETDIRDGILWLRTPTAMMGYLNAPSPFDENGWYNTSDQVEVKGDLIRVLGRKSEIINVGGEKVFPTEIEDVILTMPGVLDVCVRGAKNPVTGHVAVAEIRFQDDIKLSDLRRKVHAWCAPHLERHKIPAIVRLAKGPMINHRLKKQRKGGLK